VDVCGLLGGGTSADLAACTSADLAACRCSSADLKACIDATACNCALGLGAILNNKRQNKTHKISTTK
jgi:hypothetical protein